METADRVLSVHMLRKAGQDIIDPGQPAVWLMSVINCFKETISLIRHPKQFKWFRSNFVGSRASKRRRDLFLLLLLLLRWCIDKLETLIIVTKHWHILHHMRQWKKQNTFFKKGVVFSTSRFGFHSFWNVLLSALNYKGTKIESELFFRTKHTDTHTERETGTERLALLILFNLLTHY